jgi:hypothetical protein
MPRRIVNPNPSGVLPKQRRRTARPLTLLGVVPDERTAEAMDDERAAEELIADLLALKDAGLIAFVQSDDALRYAPTDPDD